MVGRGREALGSTGNPHVVQSKNSFPTYGLPPTYTLPDVAHTLDENVNNSALMPIKSQQPQSDHAHVSQPMGETHEAPRDHNLASFEPYLGYATKGQAVGDIPLLDTLGGPQYRPQPWPLHFAVGRLPPAMEERGKFDHIEERMRAIERGRDHAFVDMAELCLVPNIVMPPKFKV